MNTFRKRARFARLLLLVYLPLLTVVTFHHHSEAGNENVVASCYDCIHHIHHDGHFTTTNTFTSNCALCQLQSLPYVTPNIIRIATFIAITHVAFAVFILFAESRKSDINSTRAPPAFVIY